MTTGRYREEVFNVLLALLLHQRGVVAAPEQSFREALEHRRHIPDVMVSFLGLRTVIEGKVDDQPNALEEALHQAQERVEKGIAHIGIAVLYPHGLRSVPLAQLSDALANSSLRLAICSEAGETGWTEGNLDYLVTLLHSTFDQLVKEDVVAKAVAILNEGITQFTQAVSPTPALAHRFAEILGIGEPPKRSRKAAPEDEEEDEE